jgi:hypothetical protein
LKVSQVEVQKLAEVAERDRLRVQAEAAPVHPPRRRRKERSAPLTISPGPSWQ